MRVAIVNTYDTMGGAARAAHRLFLGLRLIGEDCTMFVAQRFSDTPGVVALGPLLPEEEEEAVRLKGVIRQETAPYPTLRRPGFVPFHSDRSTLGQAMLRQLPPSDIVNLHWVRGFIDYEAFFRQHQTGRPVVWTLHDMNAFTGGCHYSGGCTGFTASCGRCPELGSDDPQDLSARILARKADLFHALPAPPTIVAPSRWMAEQVGRSLPLGHAPVVVIPYGLDTEVFRPHPPAAVRAEFGLDPDAPIVLFAAHDIGDPRKGLQRLDEALSRVPPAGDPLLVTVGGGRYDPVAPVRHRHIGLVDDDATRSRLYGAADVMVMPCLEDNLPNTLLEAMASGTAVLGFRTGGFPDVVLSGETGLLTPPGDTEALGRALADALADRARLAALGAGARAFIERNHTLTIEARRYRDLYASLLAASPHLQPRTDGMGAW